MSDLALLTENGKPVKFPEEAGVWILDEDDYVLYGMLTDPIMCAELLGEDALNHEYAGMFIVRDYQYPLFRCQDNYAGFACGRSVGKTESIKWRAVSHVFRRIKQNLLLTAPELIHLLPLTDAVEGLINRIRLARDFLDLGPRGEKTGFTHRPFGARFADGTEIIGRIPRLKGTGVKGQHQPDLIIDEAQDYPEAGWAEVHETVMKDTVDRDGNPDFTYHFYGVHSGARDSGFSKRVGGGGFTVVNVTALQRPGWCAEEKRAARAAFGGTSAPDYRRNILGEPGGAASPYFVVARLMMCVDQDRESRYNTAEVIPGQWRDPDNEKSQLIRVEEFEDAGLPISEMLDLPGGYKSVWAGMDVGLTNAPTVLTVFAEQKVGNVERLKLIRRIQLERMRTRQIREAVYSLFWTYGGALKGFGMDITGLGFPMWQEMEDDESRPANLTEIARGYFFNEKVPVFLEEGDVVKDESGQVKDRFGNMVQLEVDPDTGEERYVTYMPMIEASTRFLRELVDSGKLMLPFDPTITSDMTGESQQRVKRIAGLKNKPNAFHILDSMRAMAMKYRSGDVEQVLAGGGQEPVYEVTF